MSWVAKMMRSFSSKGERAPDPQALALQATIRDLRRVSSELHGTNAALRQRVTSLKGEPDDRPA